MEDDNELTTTLLQITWFVELVEVIPKWPNVSGCFRFKNYYNSSNVCWFLMIGGRKLCFELPFAILSQVRLGWRSGVLGDFEGRIGVPVVQLLWLSPPSGAVACDDSRIRCRRLVACRCFFCSKHHPWTGNSRSQPTRIEWNVWSVALW